MNDEVNEPARELLDLLKNHGINLKVFSFTVDEICRVIGGYVERAYRYPIIIPVESIYSTLKRRNWTAVDAMKVIEVVEFNESDRS